MQEPYLNGLSVLFRPSEPDHYGNAGLDMRTSMVILKVTKAGEADRRGLSDWYVVHLCLVVEHPR